MESEYKYNSWPLGRLPVDFQRTEPGLIRGLGYEWNDPREIVDIFENKIASFTGAKYCVLTDSCTSGLFLSLKFRQHKGSISIPTQTYVSVAMQILESGAAIEFREEKWSGIYELIGANIYDSAARFGPNIYVGSDALQVLSFQIKKRLPIGKGGAILTDSLSAYRWLKSASYDGRNLKTAYDDPRHIETLGWHLYMTPEDAARGIILMDKLGNNWADVMDWSHYPPITKYNFFRENLHNFNGRLKL
jgi:dTDP-4-amino-4,6-dideoxygalactose transaminase